MLSPPVAGWLVFLVVLDEMGAATSTLIGLEAQRRTRGLVGKHLNHVVGVLRRLEATGVVTSARIDPPKATIVWCLTDEGRGFLREARDDARLALVRRQARRRKGGMHGGEEKQWRGQRRGHRRR